MVLYGLMMAQQLTNTFDGLWNQTYYHAGLPELTSGRWLLHYIDKLTLGCTQTPSPPSPHWHCFSWAFCWCYGCSGSRTRW